MAESKQYRPLLRLAAHPQQYLPVPFAYSLPQISTLKKYLPKTITYHGVDALQTFPSQAPLLEKHKLKLKAVAGQHITTGQLLNFLAMEELVLKEWNVGLVMQVSYNNSMSQEDQQQHIAQAIISALPLCLGFYHKQKQYLLPSTDGKEEPLQHLELVSTPKSRPSSTYENTTLTLKYDLQVVLPLVRKEKYSPKELFGLLEDDLSNCLRIMRKYGKGKRICQTAYSQNVVLCLQSFVGEDQQELQQQQATMNGLVEDGIENSLEQIELAGKESPQPTQRKDLSNKSLLLILLGLFLIYIFLKVHPLKKILGEL